MTEHPHEHHSVREELDHLHAVAEKGDSGETPFILMGEVATFLAPVVVLLLSLAFGAYYLL